MGNLNSINFLHTTWRHLGYYWWYAYHQLKLMHHAVRCTVVIDICKQLCTGRDLDWQGFALSGICTGRELYWLGFALAMIDRDFHPDFTI